MLHYNKLEPHNVVLMLTGPLQLCDKNGMAWTFIARRQTRLYLLAKYEQMESFKEVYSIGHGGSVITPFFVDPYRKVGLMHGMSTQVYNAMNAAIYHDEANTDVTAATASVSVATASTSESASAPATTVSYH